ncbi:MAG: elongation factor Ts [Bacilli bacterium]|nr:elongation factor Ts [Bacilli bacterium]
MMISASMVKELREKTGAGMLDCKKALEETNGNLDAAIDWLREKGISKAAKKADRIAAEGLAQVLIDENDAIIVEVNSETDFVAKNPEFVNLVDTIAKALINSDAKTVEDALKVEVEGNTIESIITEKTATIGEKLSLRRFTKVTKNDDDNFGSYIHMGGKIAVLTVLNKASEEVAKEVAMQSAAMRPTYVKPTDIPTEVLEKEKDIMRAELANEGKPADKIENILVGKVNKYYEEVCLENQIFIKAENKETVAKYVSNNGGSIVDMIRYEVGEGMEKREENFAEEVAKAANV